MYERKIGVIVPVYNVEKYLRECIESVLNQTYSNLDIILVDDGSTDSSGSICDEYQKKDARIRTIHQENAGLLMARYNGLKECDCEYVTFVDSDDWLDLNTYSIVAKHLGDIDIVAFGAIRYYSANDLRIDPNLLPKGKYLKKELDEFVIPNMIWNIEKNYYNLDSSLCVKVAKRELLLNSMEKVKALGIYYGEDSAVLFPMVKEAQSLVILEDCLYYHRQRSAGEVRPYIKDEKYMSKLWTLYSFLMDQFAGYNECKRRIDYFYFYSIQHRKRVYGEYVNNDRYIFPFSMVQKNSNIVLYAAGDVGQTYYDQLRRTGYCNVVAWVDKNYQNYQRNGMTIVDCIDVIKDVEFDYIVIAVLSSQSAQFIKNDLMARGVAEDKIIWYNK